MLAEVVQDIALGGLEIITKAAPIYASFRLLTCDHVTPLEEDRPPHSKNVKGFGSLKFSLESNARLPTLTGQGRGYPPIWN